jgi:triosephosphate isomerase
MSDIGAKRPILGVSLKLYLSVRGTREWLAGLAQLASSGGWTEQLTMFVCPELLMVEPAISILGGCGVRVGAQDSFWEPRGAYTGEVSPASLAELGVGYVELGHAERRRLFGESDGDVAAKVRAAVGHGLTPVVCIGEPERGAPADAVAFCRAQVDGALSALPETGAPLIFAYEPIWAIGADAAAGPDHIQGVLAGLRGAAGGRRAVRWIYGGSAGRDLYASISGTVDGLFVGRAAHDLTNLAAIVTEMTRPQAGP